MVSKRQQKRNFNPDIDIPPLAFKELSDEGVKLWYQFDNKDRKIIVSMHEYPKEGSSALVPYGQPKPPNLKPRYWSDHQPSNRLSNTTDVSNNGNDIMTQNDLEYFASQIISSISTMTPPQAEYQILSATSKKQDLPLLPSFPQGVPVCSLADMLPSKLGTYQICDKQNKKGESKSRGMVQVFTATITSLPSNCRFDHLPTNETIVNNGVPHLYSVSKNVRSSKVMALIDGGANGGIAGTADSRRMDPPSQFDRHVNVTSVGDHTINDIPIARFFAVSRSQYGNVLCAYHEYAGGRIQERTIHSKIQLADYGNKVDDTTMKLGGQQTIIAHGGHIFQLSMSNGLCYLEQLIPTDTEMHLLPQVIMTSD